MSRWSYRSLSRTPEERGVEGDSCLAWTAARWMRLTPRRTKTRSGVQPPVGDRAPTTGWSLRSFDPLPAPAEELAALDHERSEIEKIFDELKTRLRGHHIVLRSKTPELVRQEF